VLADAAVPPPADLVPIPFAAWIPVLDRIQTFLVHAAVAVIPVLHVPGELTLAGRLQVEGSLLVFQRADLVLTGRSPACQRALDHSQSSAKTANPRRTGLAWGYSAKSEGCRGAYDVAIVRAGAAARNAAEAAGVLAFARRLSWFDARRWWYGEPSTAQQRIGAPGNT
jgi:hypothetical protein